MKILAIVTARGGSKGIPRKNIKLLNGKPLISYTAEAIKDSKLIDRAVCSSEDDEIINIANDYGLETPFKRPAELAKDDTPSLLVLQHAVKILYELDDYVPDIIVNLQPTSPFRKKGLIDSAIEIFINAITLSIVVTTYIAFYYQLQKNTKTSKTSKTQKDTKKPTVSK